MQYSYQNQGQDHDGDEKDSKEKEKKIKAKKHQLQSGLLIAESDYNKEERKAEDLKFEVVQLKREIDRTNVNIEDKNEELKKIDKDQQILEEDIKKIKKKLKAL